MKKTLIAGAVLVLCSQGAMAATDWNLTAGTDVWASKGTSESYNDDWNNWNDDADNNYNWNGYLQLEHGIIFLPNAKFEVSDLSSEGDRFNKNLTAYDMSLYYRLFNNDLFKIDLGLTGRHYDGDWSLGNWGGSYSENNLMGYVGTEATIPGTGIGAFGDVRVRDEDNYDYRLGASYKFSAVPVKLRAGWREVKVDYTNIHQSIDGWFMGAAFTF
ncbi:MAG: TIGR04219 family outer membrane beta-barrel protein [Aeromonas sp.]